jgi:hypothetical protein
VDVQDQPLVTLGQAGLDLRNQICTGAAIFLLISACRSTSFNLLQVLTAANGLLLLVVGGILLLLLPPSPGANPFIAWPVARQPAETC